MHKMAYIGTLWVCVWSLVSVLTLAINCTGLEFPVPVRTGIITALLVPLMVYGIIPRLRGIMKNN